MKANRLWILLTVSAIFGGCATLPRGWKEYRAAIKCDLENKAEECDKAYLAAIKKNPELPGLRASYGSHLYKRGESAQAEQEFQEEVRNHPESGKAIGVVLKKNLSETRPAGNP